VVLDRKGKVQVHEQPRGWMGNGRGFVHVSKRTQSWKKWNTATEGKGRDK
jgi:hypothetical protein